ncbi:MAG: phosphopantetheine-binding protein [Hyphomicrobiales bacterium]
MTETAGKEGTDTLEERIVAIVVREGMIDREKLVPEATLEDLGVDSVEVVMILNGIEEEFGIYVPIDETMSEVRTVGDLLGVIKGIVEKKAAEPQAE